MYSGARLNWLGDFFTDKNIGWDKRTVTIDDLTFTGTNPDWNEILMDKCKRSPKTFRKLLVEDKNLRTIFKEAVFSDDPILVRKEDSLLKVLDGTHRLVAAIIHGKQEIEAFVADSKGNPKPACEPHVVYDLIRAYQRGQNHDKKGLVASLKFLRKAYSNVDDLLKNRFSDKWINNEDIQKLIKEALSS